MTTTGRTALLVSILTGATAGAARAQTPPAITTDTIVLLPDTQYYSKYDGATFNAQTDWIAAQPRNLMKMVMHLGDITNDDAEDQWDRAVSAMSRLGSGETAFPYVMVPGNHDNPKDGEVRDTGLFRQHFPTTGFVAQGGHEWVSLDGTSDNSYALFSAGGRDFMVVNLEFAPRKDALCRASKAIDAHPNRAVIIATHCYQGGAGNFQDCTTRYKLIGSNGKTIWDELARRHSNVQMIVSGHMTGSAVTQRSQADGLQTLIANGGSVPARSVVEILTDFQFVRNNFPDDDTLRGRNAGAQHGMGWMRTLSFFPGPSPTLQGIRLNTFSVLNPDDAAAQLQAYKLSEKATKEHSFPPPEREHHAAWDFNVPRLPAYSFDAQLLNVHDFTVNAGSNGNQIRPRVAGTGAGAMRVVWADDLNDNNVYQVKGRGFTPDGCESVAQQTINVAAAGQQRAPAIAVGNDGSMVVVWEDDHDENGVAQIYAAGFDALGQRRFGDIVVNEVAAGQQLRPDVEMDSAGNFVVVWQDDLNENGVYEIRASRWDATGHRLRPDFTVNGSSAGNQRSPRIAMRRGGAEDGEFVVAWEDDLNENGVYQIKAARFLSDGSKRFWSGGGPNGPTDVTINQFPDGQQLRPSIALRNNTGDFVIAWQDDRNENGVFQVKMAGFDWSGAKKVWGPNGEEDETVNMGAAGNQQRPQVSMNNQGHFAVVWEDDLNENNVFQIKAAGYAFGTRATRLGTTDAERADQTVNSIPAGQQRDPDVLLFDNDQVYVVWQDDTNENEIQEIVGRAYVLGHEVDVATETETDDTATRPLFANMDGAPWFATQGAITTDERSTIGPRSISFQPGFTEARTPGFATGSFSPIGSKLLVDVFVPGQQPASSYKGAVQLYWSVPGAGQNHQFVGQKELSPLAGNAWHTLEFDLPDTMRRLFLESHANADLAFSVNTQADAPARTLLDNLRFGGVLVPHSTADCDSAACLSVCGPGKASCDGNATNGCEIYLANSRSNCGTCGHSCGAGTCINGACEAAGARNITTSIAYTSEWDTGYCAALTFTNQSLAPVAWEVVLDLRGSTITSSWNGAFSAAQGVVGVSGVGWNNVIQPGASLQSLGFCAQRSVGGNKATVVRTNAQFQ